MQATAAAKTLATQTQVSDSTPKNNLIDPGKLQLPDLDLMREQAASLNPHYQINCILSDLYS